MATGSSINQMEQRFVTIENEDQYQRAIARLQSLANLPDDERDEGAFLDLSAAMVAYEASLITPAES